MLAFSLFFKVVLFAFELDLNTIFSLGLALMPSAQSSLANILPSAIDFSQFQKGRLAVLSRERWTLEIVFNSIGFQKLANNLFRDFSLCFKITLAAKRHTRNLLCEFNLDSLSQYFAASKEAKEVRSKTSRAAMEPLLYARVMERKDYCPAVSQICIFILDLLFCTIWPQIPRRRWARAAFWSGVQESAAGDSFCQRLRYKLILDSPARINLKRKW